MEAFIQPPYFENKEFGGEVVILISSGIDLFSPGVESFTVLLNIDVGTSGVENNMSSSTNIFHCI